MVTLLLAIPMWYDLYSCSHSPMATTKMLWADEEGGTEGRRCKRGFVIKWNYCHRMAHQLTAGGLVLVQGMTTWRRLLLLRVLKADPVK